MGKVLARLRFHAVTAPVSGSEDWGELTVHNDGTVRLQAGDGLRSRLLRTAERTDAAALMYGAGAFMGIAALGATLVLQRKRAAGFATLALAGLTALGATGVRKAARNAPRLFETHFDREDVQGHIGADGTLTVTLAGKPWRGTTLRIESGEYDAGQAEQFLSALRT